MRVQVTAPYVTLRVTDPSGVPVVLGYMRGSIVDNVHDESLRHHLERGLVEQYDEAGDAPDEESGAPAKSAPKAEWVTYAVAQGMDADDAEEMTKDALIEQFGEG